MARTNRRAAAFGLGVLLVAGCVIPAAGAAQPATGDPLRIVPPESLFCIKINNLSATLGQMDQFLTGLAPFGVSMLVQSQFAKVLGSPDPNSINMSGDFAVFGPLPGGETPDLKRIGILIPVTDYQKFVTSNPNVTPPDAQGLSKIGPEGQQWLIAVNAGSHALLTTPAGQQTLAEMKSWMPRGTTSLAQRLSAEEAKRAAGSRVWAYANVQTVSKMFGPMIQAKMQQAKEAFKQMQQQGAPIVGQPDAMVDLYTSLLNTLMQETQSVSLSLDPTPTAIRAAFLASAVPDSGMAKTLSAEGSQPQQQANLLGYLENGAIMNLVATPSPAFVKATSMRRVELFTKMLGQALSPEDVARVKKLATDATDAFAGPSAMSLLPELKSKPPIGVKQVSVLRDRQKYNSVLDEAVKMMSEPAFTSLFQKFGVKLQVDLKRNAETYKDTPIDAAHVAFQAADANAPQGQALAMMFGGGLDLRMAVVNNLLLTTVSAEPQKAIQALIDQAKAGSTQAPSEVQAAAQLLPEAKQAELFGTYNYARAIQMAMAFMPITTKKNAKNRSRSTSITR